MGSSRSAVYAPERRGYQPTQNEPSKIKLPQGPSPTEPAPSPSGSNDSGSNDSGSNANNSDSNNQ